MPRILAYLRVSSDEQAASGLGLEAQLQAIAKQFGEPDLIFKDEGHSGGTLDRPGLAAMLEAVERGDTVAVAKLDRLSRGDPFAIAWLEKEITQKRKACIRSAAGEGTDDDTPQGELLRSIIKAFERFELSMIRQRTSAAVRVKMERKRKQGEKTGGYVPYGYAVVVDVDGTKRLTPDTGEQATLATMFRLRADGGTLRTIAAYLDQHGIPTRGGGKWSPKVVHYILLRHRTMVNSEQKIADVA